MSARPRDRVSELRSAIGPRHVPAAQPGGERDKLIEACRRAHGHIRRTVEITFQQLDEMRPLPLPPLAECRADITRRFHSRQPIEEPADKDQLSAWLDSCKARANARGDNARRLRSTMWAQVKAEGVGMTDYVRHFADFHRRYWAITELSADGAEREAQVLKVVKQLEG